ncbi:MAG: PhoH family protein [Treponema sp.]|nr:PhoH family protein [Treponema sp.]
MDSQFTIVLPDSGVLAQICGTNDRNLQLIENHLGVPVFTRGNELSLETEDVNIREQFKFIIDRIVDEISDSGESGTDMVVSILNAGDSNSFNSRENFISIPGGKSRIYPKTRNQAELISAFRKSELVFACGPAGSGKTFLAVAEALRLLLSHKVSKIILTRPIVEAGESLGFLPGDLQEKVNPYLRPLYDSMNACIAHDIMHRLTENGIIETAPLAYMRGRSLNNCVVILDEAQNTTVEQMKMFLTRMGENSRVFITGDITQTDLPKRTPSGLLHALKVLADIPEISIINLDETDVVRSELVRKIVQAYQNEQECQ